MGFYAERMKEDPMLESGIRARGGMASLHEVVEARRRPAFFGDFSDRFSMEEKTQLKTKEGEILAQATVRKTYDRKGGILRKTEVKAKSYGDLPLFMQMKMHGNADLPFSSEVYETTEYDEKGRIIYERAHGENNREGSYRMDWKHGRNDNGPYCEKTMWHIPDNGERAACQIGTGLTTYDVAGKNPLAEHFVRFHEGTFDPEKAAGIVYMEALREYDAQGNLSKSAEKRYEREDQVYFRDYISRAVSAQEFSRPAVSPVDNDYAPSYEKTEEFRDGALVSKHVFNEYTENVYDGKWERDENGTLTKGIIAEEEERQIVSTTEIYDAGGRKAWEAVMICDDESFIKDAYVSVYEPSDDGGTIRRSYYPDGEYREGAAFGPDGRFERSVDDAEESREKMLAFRDNPLAEEDLVFETENICVFVSEGPHPVMACRAGGHGKEAPVTLMLNTSTATVAVNLPYKDRGYEAGGILKAEDKDKKPPEETLHIGIRTMKGGTRELINAAVRAEDMIGGPCPIEERASFINDLTASVKERTAAMGIGDMEAPHPQRTDVAESL